MSYSDGIVDQSGSRLDRFGLLAKRRGGVGVVLLCFFALSNGPALAGGCEERVTIIRASGGGELVLDRTVEGTSTLRLAGIDPAELASESGSGSSVGSSEA